MEIAEALARRDPAHAGWQRDLAVSYHKIGSLEAIGNPGEARELLEKGRAIIARLAGIAAHQAQWRSDLGKFDEVLRTLRVRRGAAGSVRDRQVVLPDGSAARAVKVVGRDDAPDEPPMRRA